MDDSRRRTELAAFLRTKRAAIAPDAYGLLKGTRRRTPGLRREEVAARANIGVAWYTWLEQGRDIHVSREVVGRIAVALNLSTSERTYLESLAASQSALPTDDWDAPVGEAQEIVDGFGVGPAMLWNARFDCVAYNHLADVIYDWSRFSEPFGLNVIWRFFMDDDRRKLYSEAEHLVYDCVGMLRARYASQLGDPSFESLVRVLLTESQPFADLWIQQRIAGTQTVPFVLTHPIYGRLSLRSMRASFPQIPGSMLIFGTPSDDSTRTLLKSLR